MALSERTIIAYARRRNKNNLRWPSLYGKVIKFSKKNRILFDEKLIWNSQLDKVREKGKNLDVDHSKYDRSDLGYKTQDDEVDAAMTSISIITVCFLGIVEKVTASNRTE